MAGNFFCDNFYEFLTDTVSDYSAYNSLYFNFSDLKLASLEMEHLNDVLSYKKLSTDVTFNLWHNYITGRGAKFLASWLKKSQTPEKLNLILAKNFLGDLGANYFADCLPYTHDGFALDLSANNITNTTAANFAKHLIDMPHNFSLNLANNKITADGIFDLANAFLNADDGFRLDLSKNDIGIEGAYYIADNLSLLPKKACLILSSCQMQLAGLNSICSELSHAPENFTLDLSNNQLKEGQGDDIAETVCHALQQTRQPKNLVLNLGELGITEVGAHFFLEMAQNGNAPEGLILQLNNNEISQSLIDKIEKALRHHDQMRALMRCFAFHFGTRENQHFIAQLPNEMLAQIYTYVLPQHDTQSTLTATNRIFNFFRNPSHKRKHEEEVTQPNKKLKEEPSNYWPSCLIS